MRAKLAALLREKGLIPRGSTVFAALSGGADSVALTHLLFSLQEDLGFRMEACHFNHNLRGEESRRDEAFCREFCQKLGIPLTVGQAEVSLLAQERGESLEETARNCRYDFFAALPGLVATAHTKDDVAETVLLNLLRGTGLKGLCGIPEIRGQFVRPLLSFTRQDVVDYLNENNLPHVEDSSNGGDDYLRNRLRHRVMPLLKEENPAFLEAVERMTGLLRQEEVLLSGLTEALLQKDEEGAYALAPLLAAPEALRRRAIHHLLEGKVKKLSFSHILGAEEVLLAEHPSKVCTLPGGLRLRREYDRFFLEQEAAVATFQPVTLPCPGSVKIPELDLCFTCHVSSPSPITIRPRKQGDEIQLSGGRKSVKKVLIDKKIPLARRELVPVLEQEGNILSLWGVADTPGFAGVTTKPKEKEEMAHD